MHVSHTNTDGLQVFREILRHPLGQRRDQHTLTTTLTLSNLRQQVIDLTLHRSDRDPRINQSGRSNDLLDHDTTGLLELPVARSRRREDRLRHNALPLFKLQRPVVEC